MAAKFEIRSPGAGQYTWVLISLGRTMATSETYSRRDLAEKAIESFRTAAANATVIDTTLAAAETPSGAVAEAAATTKNPKTKNPKTKTKKKKAKKKKKKKKK